MNLQPLALATPIAIPVEHSILADVDQALVSEASRRESRNREVHLPPLSTFRWWARRTGAVNEAILHSATRALGRERLDVLDPFAGGGTIPLVALRAGHHVHAQDLNPWAAAGMRQMLSLPAAVEIRKAHAVLGELAAPMLRAAYSTTMSDGRAGSLVHTYRVAVATCSQCGCEHRQFPYSMISLLYRKERKRPEAFLACRAGHVFEGRTDEVASCPECATQVDPSALYTPRREVTCPSCQATERLSERAAGGGWRWEVALVERVGVDGRREFALPTADELAQAEQGWRPARTLGTIPLGAETNVLLRHGFSAWEDLFPARQRVVTEQLLTLAGQSSSDEAVVAALRIAIVGTTEFAGHLSRWDRYYLKCNDATAGHRFNFSTFVPELNVWGAGSVGRGTVTRRVGSMAKAADWFSTHVRSQSSVVVCGDSAEITGEPRFDLVLTDPPYHDDVHYGELSLFFRAWAGLPVDTLNGEAVANSTTGVNADSVSYAASLERIFRASRRVLRDSGRLVFSYANHEPEAWVALFAALEAAGFHAVACVSVHSENETDFKKRNVKSCTEDLLLELSPVALRGDAIAIGRERENRFMREVGRWFTRVGQLECGWEEVALAKLQEARRGL